MLRTAMTTPDRTRAAIDPRWDQETISRARLLVIGGGLVGKLAALFAAGLGFRQVVLVAAGERLSPWQDRLWPDLELFRVFVKTRYSDVLFPVLSNPLPVQLLGSLVRQPDVCIAVLDDPNTSDYVLQASQLVDPSRRVYVRAKSKGAKVAVGCIPEDLPADMPATAAGALLGAGLALSEVRRLVAPCEDDCDPEGPISFMLPFLPARIRELRMAGAGGTGTLFGLACRFVYNSLHIWDGDVVEASNLPRCPWLSTLGMNKATDLANNIVPLGMGVSWTQAHPCHAGPDWLDGALPGCIAAFCTDTLAGRKALNSAACKNGIPAVNMGTSLFGASVYAIGAGGPCLECRFPDLDDRIAAEAAEQRISCGRRPEAAASISNMIAAGAAGLIAPRLRVPGFTFPGVLSFDAFSPARLSLGSLREPCGCFAKGGDLANVAV